MWMPVNCENGINSYEVSRGKHVEAGAALYTAALLSCEGVAGEYAHQVVDHAAKYVDGEVHVNGLENFWSLLKLPIKATFVSVEPFHMFRYTDEQTYRYNYRKDMTDADRFSQALSQIAGKRLTGGPARRARTGFCDV